MKKTGQQSYVFVICFIAAFGGLMFGFDIAVISGTVPFIQSYFELSELALGWGVSALLLGCIPGAMISGRLADNFGRRVMMMGVALLFVITSILTALSLSFPMFIVARLLGGLAVGAASVISPLYIAEIAPAGIRGKLVSLNQLTITLGIFISYIVNYLLYDIGDHNWRWMFASGVLPALAFFFLLFLVPESPRWLFSRGKHALAEDIVKKIGLERLASSVLNSDSKQSVQDFQILRNPLYRKPLIVGIFLALFVQLSGINTVIDYAPVILKVAGNAIDVALFQTFIIGFVNFAFTFIAIFSIDRIGRKPLYIIGSLGMSLSLGLLGLDFLFGFGNEWTGLVLILTFIAFFAACIGPVFWVLLSEIFPDKIRGMAVSIAVFVNWSANFLVVLFFPHVLQTFGGSFTFLFLAMMCTLMMFFTMKYVPETKGKSLEDIGDEWAQPKPDTVITQEHAGQSIL